MGKLQTLTTAAYDLHWQALAKKWDCALLGPSYHVLNDKVDRTPGGSEHWFDVRRGSEKTYLRALDELAIKAVLNCGLNGASDHDAGLAHPLDDSAHGCLLMLKARNQQRFLRANKHSLEPGGGRADLAPAEKSGMRGEFVAILRNQKILDFCAVQSRQHCWRPVSSSSAGKG